MELSADTTAPTDTTTSADTTVVPDLSNLPASGCGASVVSPWSVLALVALLPLAFFRKKKENE